jgi:hypothetical protein
VPGMRLELGARLRERRPEIEQAIRTRVHGVSDPNVVPVDPEYAAGLRTAVTAALDYGIDCIEAPAFSESVPEALRFQARAAARTGVSVDTVLRRYFTGYALLGDFLMQVAEQDPGLQGESLQLVLRDKAALLDRLVATVADEHSRELRSRPTTAGQRRSERVRMLLSGELIDAPELDYELDAWHLGAIAAGPGALEALRSLAAAADRQLLSVQAGRCRIWAWLGGRRPPQELPRLAAELPAEVVLVLGEPAHGLPGWRLTHQQAKSALPIALRQPGAPVRYSEVALLSAVLQDEVLARSLEQLYLEPLARGGDGGEMLRQTLSAYFAAARNAAAAAALLGVSRQTVNSRLQQAEERLGRTLDSCAVEMEAALRLGEWDSSLFATVPAERHRLTRSPDKRQVASPDS